MKTPYTVVKQDGKTVIRFHDHKSCSCGIDYKEWNEIKENEYGYWFDCPICKSTMLAIKDGYSLFVSIPSLILDIEK